MNEYSDPVARLLAIGDPTKSTKVDWPDYPNQYGLTQEDIPELIRMVTDMDLYYQDSTKDEIWGNLHAWRALGQLKAETAVRPLLSLLHLVDDEQDDWVGEDLPEAIALIGPAAIPAISEYLADPNNKLWAKVSAVAALEMIGKQNPEAREAAIATLAGALENYPQNDEIMNGDLVSSLAELKAVEHAPLVEQAFQSGKVDESIMGDWEDYQVKVGLLKERLTERKRNNLFSQFFGDGALPRSTAEPAPKTTHPSAAKKEKNKQKQEKQSRKKNRKKK